MSVQLDSASLEKFLKQFTDKFTPELADHFASLPPDPSFQARLDELGAKANEALSPKRSAASTQPTSKQWTSLPCFASKPLLAPKSNRCIRNG